jgi:hypothetical protein
MDENEKGEKMAATQPFKYMRGDFGGMPVVLRHLTIYLNFLEDRVEASNLLDMTARSDCDVVELDADSLEIRAVEWHPIAKDDAQEAGTRPLEYNYQRDRKKLVVELPRTVRAGERFRVRTVTHCFPSDHILEGIYKDVTPPGAPQQYMSQCQQWGFQRIMPIFDDCRAKCTMTTTIEADAAYTHLISNGNIDRHANPNGNPVPNQFIIHTPDATYFQSYQSIIVKTTFEDGERKVYLDENKWDYSKTTGKYRNLFLGETKKETEKKIASGEYELVDLNK